MRMKIILAIVAAIAIFCAGHFGIFKKEKPPLYDGSFDTGDTH
jgi:hypothetical protein